MSLNAEAMQELIDDLRNQPGTYLKATGRLKDHRGGFCCLGRACEIAVKHGVIPPPTHGKSVYDDETWYYGEGREAATLPEEVRAWFGFRTSCPSYDFKAFTEMNDGGMSHPRIADVFEAMLEADLASFLPVTHSHKEA